jgi:hypothetical protein
MMLTLTEIWEMPWFYVVVLVVFFGLIVLGVMMAKKYLKPFQTDEKPKSDKEISEEEVSRLVRPIEDEAFIKQMEKTANNPDDGKPTPAQNAAAEVARSTWPVESETAKKEMEAYAKAHPEEAKEAQEAAKKSDK